MRYWDCLSEELKAKYGEITKGTDYMNYKYEFIEGHIYSMMVLGSIIQGRFLKVIEDKYLLFGSAQNPSIIYYQDIESVRELNSFVGLEEIEKSLKERYK